MTHDPVHPDRSAGPGPEFLPPGVEYAPRRAEPGSPRNISTGPDADPTPRLAAENGVPPADSDPGQETCAASSAPPGVPSRTVEERMHPLGPLVRMWIVIVALGWFFVSSLLQGEPVLEGLGFLRTRAPWWVWVAGGGLIVGLAMGYWAWWTMTFTIDDTELRIENRGAFQESKRIAFSRIQSVDVTQPFAARLLGLAELTIDIGGDAPTKLAFLTRSRAGELRDYLMVRAHGRAASTAEIAAGERASAWNDLADHDEVLIKLSPGELILGGLASLELPGLLLALLIPAGLAWWFEEIPFVAVGVGIIPLALALLGFVNKRVLSQFNYTLARTPAGLRITRGLFTLKSQTIPEHRVQAIKIVQPLPWRWIGRSRVELTILGMANLGEDDSAPTSTLLLPIGRPDQVQTAVSAIWPGLRLDALTFTPMHPRARWLAPLSYRWQGWSIDDQMTVSRVGWLTRTHHVVPHARLQSALVPQGPLMRRFRVAPIKLHTSQLLGTEHIPYLDEMDARALVFELTDRARAARTDELLHPPGLRTTPPIGPDHLDTRGIAGSGQLEVNDITGLGSCDTDEGRTTTENLLDDGPFFHGTIADLQPGDLLTAGNRSNYRPEIVMNHIYFTALRDGAGLAAEIAVELAGGGVPRVYRVEPTGEFENDPNVTDKKFPGNPTRSYRSAHPLRIVGEVTDWTRLTPEALQIWRGRLAALLADEHAEIIN